MGRLNWNYANRPYLGRPWSIVMIVALIGCVHAVWWRASLVEQRDLIIEQLGQLSRTSDRGTPTPGPAFQPALTAVFSEMQYPWIDMLDRLRLAIQPGIEIRTLEPDAGAIHRVHVTGVASQSKAVLDFVAALQKDPSWSSVQLVSEVRNDAAATSTNSSLAPPLPGLPSMPGAVAPVLSFSLIVQWKHP